ncbi:hypothetical protein EVAR_87573_1 [Eumeta japonica]|uniref:Uncharacterized protein n=1 Tax=Eumeta variegata TaxID=151549 RepID=A0A4C1WL77_EUMVA|nr:hypothetical protein EVAR_87573_1 [Eumeta japonica]
MELELQSRTAPKSGLRFKRKLFYIKNKIIQLMSMWEESEFEDGLDSQMDLIDGAVVGMSNGWTDWDEILYVYSNGSLDDFKTQLDPVGGAAVGISLKAFPGRTTVKKHLKIQETLGFGLRRLRLTRLRLCAEAARPCSSPLTSDAKRLTPFRICGEGASHGRFYGFLAIFLWPRLKKKHTSPANEGPVTDAVPFHAQRTGKLNTLLRAGAGFC